MIAEIKFKIFCGDILRLMSYMISGIVLISFDKLYFAVPLGFVFMFLGNFIENINNELKEKIK